MRVEVKRRPQQNSIRIYIEIKVVLDPVTGFASFEYIWTLSHWFVGIDPILLTTRAGMSYNSSGAHLSSFVSQKSALLIFCLIRAYCVKD